MAFKTESSYLNALEITNAGLRIDESPSTSGAKAPGPFSPAPTNQIVQRDQPFHCHFSWTGQGFLHAMFAAPPGPGHAADWRCTVYFERIGGGAGPTFNSPLIAFTGGNRQTYSRTITIPANSLAVGVYRVSCTITCRHHNGMPLPTAAFEEGMMVQIYEA